MQVQCATHKTTNEPTFKKQKHQQMDDTKTGTECMDEDKELKYQNNMLGNARYFLKRWVLI